jgi:hypothetical protein
MSGGHFDYQQYRLEDMASMIDDLIATNDSTLLDNYGCPKGYGYSPATIQRFKLTAHTLRQAAAMTQRVDWLVSGDDGEDDFHRRWDATVTDDAQARE